MTSGLCLTVSELKLDRIPKENVVASQRDRLFNLLDS